MKNNYFLLLLALIFVSAGTGAQTVYPCYTTQKTKLYKSQHPEITAIEKQLDDQIHDMIVNKNLSQFARGKKTNSLHVNWDDYYDIPVVVHVIHNYGPELTQTTDNQIYGLIAEMNRFYSLENDTSAVVKAFKQYVGMPKFRFHLASLDPNGNPTKGITHRFNYLTYGGDDYAKFDQWAPTSYINIWFIGRIGEQVPNGIVVAYAVQPPDAAVDPYRDGIIANYSFINDAASFGSTGGSIDHEMGHIMYLWHTFGKTNDPGPSHTDPATNYSGYCSDDDDVDDTPPTDGCLGCCNLTDTVCSQNYFKIYPRLDSIAEYGADSLVVYPNIAYEQDIMNYASCKQSFTKGQVERMRGALNSNVAGRSNLWTDTNLMYTGVIYPDLSFIPTPDLKPIPDFSVKNAAGVNTYFTTPTVPLTFTSQCFNDTVISVNWTFSNGASLATASNSESALSKNNVASSVSNTFSVPGWVTVSITASGNNTGDSTLTNTNAVFVADATGTNPTNYIQDFNPSGDRAKWPSFNYYNNNFMWQLNDQVGLYDHSCIQYVGFDTRSFPQNAVGIPTGDFDDFFSVPVDLSSFGTGQCNLNYSYSGATRTSSANDMNDTLEILYSTDGSKTWTLLKKLSQAQIANMGSVATAYVPQYETDWAPMTIPIPQAARTNYTIFCWRYLPSTNGTNAFSELYSTGNNFYMDNIYFSNIPEGLTNLKLGSTDVAVVPNPTTSDAYVIIKDASNTEAKIVVTDVTGKTVYSTSDMIINGEVHVTIPHEVISVQGLYMVQVSTGNQVQTKKLVVY